MEIRVLEYFLAVAREQNITAAAEALHISQPALSRQLKNLEEELGKQLLIRGVKGSRKVLLTEEGMILRKRAEEQARKMINDNEIMAGAKAQANELMRQADAKAKEMIAMAEKRSNELRGVADDYCEDALRRTEEAVNAALNEVKQSRSKFRSLAGLGNNRPTKTAYDVAAEEG